MGHFSLAIEGLGYVRVNILQTVEAPKQSLDVH